MKKHAAVARSTFSCENAQNKSGRTTFWSSNVEKLYAAVARSAFASQNAKTPQVQSDFCSSDVQKWQAAVARSIFASQNAQNTSAPHPFLLFQCPKKARRWFASQNVQNILGPEQLSFFRFPKMARRCGAKHICKSKCTKHHMLGPLFVEKLQLQMWTRSPTEEIDSFRLILKQ